MESPLETVVAVELEKSSPHVTALADSEQRKALRSDYVGISLSWICLVHCLLLPFLVPFVPFMVFFTDEWIHPFISSGMILAALWAFVRGYRIHGSQSVLAMGVSGVCVLAAVMLAGEIAPSFLEQQITTEIALRRETVLSVLASIFLIGGHLRNISSCRCKPLSSDACSC